LGFDLGSEPIKGLRQAAGTELQAEAIAQNGAAFAQGKAFGLVPIADLAPPMVEPTLIRGIVDAVHH
jgi:uncharacterized membrane protein YqiK